MKMRYYYYGQATKREESIGVFILVD